MQVNRTAAACTWREAFGELLVLDQDFDTAMQIMISQDDKVAQLSLEESQQTRSKHTKQTKGESRSPNRKRRCIDLKDTSRPKSPPYPSPCIHLAAPTRVGIRLNDTLAADRLIGVYDSRVDIAANRTSTQCSKNVASNHLPTIAESDKKVSISETKLDEMLMQQDSFRDSFQASVSANTMLNSTFKQHDASFKIGYRGEGKTGSNADIHGADSRDGTVTKSVTSLFCTGSGKPVPISKTTLNAYEKQMQFDDSNQFVFFNAALAATSKQLEAGLQSTCGGNGQTGVNADVDVSGHDKSAEKKSVTSLFSTGSGKQISILKTKLDAYEKQMRIDDSNRRVSSNSALAFTSKQLDAGLKDDQVGGRQTDVNADVDASGRDRCSEKGFVTSLFCTGSGKQLSILKTKRDAYEKQMRMDDSDRLILSNTALAVTSKELDAGTKDSTEQTSVNADTENSSRDKKNVKGSVTSLFCTGSGKQVSISKTKLDAYEKQMQIDNLDRLVSSNAACAATSKKLDAGFENYCGGGQTGVNADSENSGRDKCAKKESVTSLFCTGSGKQVSISKIKLDAYEKQMQIDNSNRQVLSNSALAVAFKQRGGQTGVNADTESSDRGVCAEKGSVTSLFRTGSGKQVSISKSKLDTYNRQLFHEDNETVSAGKMHDFNQIGFRMINDCSTYSNLCNKLSSAIEIVGNPDVDQAVNRAVDDTTNDRTTLTVGSNLKENFLSHRLPTSKDKFHVITKFSGSSTKKVQPKFEKNVGHVDDALLSGRQGDTRRRALRDYNSSERSMDRRADFNKFTALGLKADSSHYLPDAVSGDKENISPEDMLARKVTKVQTPITLRSSMRPKQLSSRPVLNQATRQQKKVKSQSRPKLASSRQFHPPLASKSLSTSDLKCSTEERGPLTAQRSKKQKITAIQPFIYKEAMKISLAALNELYGDRRFVTKDHELARMQVLDSITAENALMVCFGQDSTTLCLLNGTHDTSLFIAPHELYRQLIAENLLLKEKGATMVWFLNHFRWIVWKLASIERAYPRLLLTQYLTKGQLLKQMTYRYRRDLNNAECSILKKVLQRDASSLSCMVLCIAGVLPFPACSQKGVDQELPPFWNLAVVLTDGWYSLYAVPDAPLAAVLWKLHTKSILVGTKIVTWNATLRNSTEGIDPLECAIVRESKWKNPLLATEEMTLWPYLQLRYNSTRRVRFNTRLGVEKLHCVTPINLRHRNQESQVSFSLLKSVPLKSLEIGGGMIRSVRIRVIRVSPILHLQSKEWTLGPRILSEEQLSLYFQLRSEYARAARQKNCRQADNDSLMDNRLDDNQIDMPLPIPFIKIDVECAHNTLQADQGIGCGILTIWRPSEDLLAGELREGAEYFASSLTISWKIDNGRGQDASLRLSSTKHSNFEKIRDDEMLANSEAPSLSKRQQVCVSIQRATKDYRANYEEGRNERRPTIDVCVCVVLVAAREIQNIPLSVVAQQTENTLLDPDIRPHETRYVEHIFVTDQSCHLMSIRLSSTEVHLPKNSSFVFRRGGKNLWKEGAVLCLRGLEVSHYDEQLRVLDCVMVESTQIVSFPSKKSPFWDPFQLLQQEASMCSTRGMTAQASSLSSKFLEELLHLKKYVERDILQINCISSQKSQEYEEVEQERLTQDLQAHEGIQDIVLDQNCTDEVARSQLWWDAKVVKMMPLLDSGSFMSVDNVEVLASVNIGTNESSFRTVYLSRRIMLAMHTLLQEADDFNSMNQLDAITANSSIFLLQSITQRLKSFKDRNAEFIFRFQVRQATNERLISSWRPWQHSHASYWKAETVVASQTPR